MNETNRPWKTFKNNLKEFHKFWFQQQKHWFSQSNNFDFTILSKFESLLDYEKLNELYCSMNQTYGLQERISYVFCCYCV